MRILFVTPYYFPELKFGGPPKRIHAISRALVGRGHDVRVVTFQSEQPRSRHQEEFDGIPVQYVPWLGRSLRQVPVRIAELNEQIREADVVHCYGLYNLLGPLTAALAIRHRKPYLLEPMGMYVPRVANVGWKKLYHFAFTSWVARKAAAVVATSPLERDELSLLTNDSQLVVRRNGVDLAEFSDLPPPKRMRDRWGAGPDDQVVLYLGRINAKKNLEQLITAFQQTALHSAILVIAGPCSEPEYLDRLRRLAGSAATGPRIVFEGPRYGEDHLAALSAANLFVMPSINENFGNAAAEAVAAGVPVLLTDTCGVAPIIHGRAGLAVPLGEESIADGLAKMLNPEIRDQMTAQREEVKRELSWDEPIAQTEALYERLIAEGGRRGAK